MPETAATTETVEKPAAETAATETEVFDKDRAMALIEKLRKENRDLSKSAQRLSEIEAAETKRKEDEMTELQKVKKHNAELEAQLKTEKITRLQLETAQRVGLPLALATRLRGETPEDLEADAQAIKEALPSKEQKPTNLHPTNPANAQQGETVEQRLARIHGASTDPFDPATMKRMGGGVFHANKPNE